MNLNETTELRYEKILQDREKSWKIQFSQGVIEYIPKSQARLVNEKLYVADWLIREKCLEDFEVG